MLCLEVMKELLDIQDLSLIMFRLAELGYEPSVSPRRPSYRRGKVWRVHLNAGSNNWVDDSYIVNGFHKCIVKELKKNE